jgi:hypothetical protein
VTVAAIRKEIAPPGAACRALSACRVICTVDRVLSTLLMVLAGLLLAGLLGTQALAHAAHDTAADAAALQIETVAPTVEAEPSTDSSSLMTDVAKCDGHCCFAGACCAGVAGPLSAVLPQRRLVETGAQHAAYGMPAAPPDGPRRPPKRDI